MSDGSDGGTAASCSEQSPLLEVRGLSVSFGDPELAVSELSFEAESGRTLAVVGESGSGKSVTALAIMRLTDYTGGRIVSGRALFRPKAGTEIDLLAAREERMRRIRGKDIAMIFQEPMTSLNPVFTIGDQIGETLVLHENLSGRGARLKAKELLRKVRLPDADRLLDHYPHQLSGGMRQRVMIAMALACSPKLLIADEPTTALDVTIQAQILDIIRDLQQETGTAVIFITHDMGVVAEMADDVVVMWQGEKVEQGTVRNIFAAPQHPYTRALLSAVPRLGSLRGKPLPQSTRVLVIEGGEPKFLGEDRVQDTADYSAPILEVERLTTRFDVGRSWFGRVTYRVHAVEEVSFAIYPGETLALVGEFGQRQNHHRADPAAAHRAHGRQRPLPRARHGDDGGGGAAPASPGDPVHFSGSLRLSRSAADCRLQHRGTHHRPRPHQDAQRDREPGEGASRAGRAQIPPRKAVPARVFGWAETAYLHCPGAGEQTQADHSRRVRSPRSTCRSRRKLSVC